MGMLRFKRIIPIVLIKATVKRQHLIALCFVGSLQIQPHSITIAHLARYAGQNTVTAAAGVQLMQTFPVQAILAFRIGAAIEPACLIPHFVGCTLGIIKDTAVEGTGTGAVPAVQFHLGLRLQKRLGLGLWLAFYPDKVGFRNQKIIHKELTAHPNINGIRLLGEIGHFQRLVQGRLLIFRWPDIRQLNVVV